MDWHRVIYLAHAPEDKPRVLKLYNKLKEAGLDPWLDEKSLRAGEDWDAKIVEAINKARFFMACLTSNSVDKKAYVHEELKKALIAVSKKKSSEVYFIPALLEDVSLPDIAVGSKRLRDYHASRLFERDGLQLLISQLQVEIQKPDITKIRHLIAKFKIEEALDTLKESVSTLDDEYVSSITLLKSQLARLNVNQRKGILTHDQYEIGMNKIVHGLTGLLSEIKEN